MLIIKGRGAREPLPETTKIWVFKCAKRNKTYWQRIFIESYAAHFDINGSFDPTPMAAVLLMEGMVSSNHLHYTQDYLTLGINSRIKPAAME